jgi:hypothetical protein
LNGTNWPAIWTKTPANPVWTGPAPAPFAFKVDCVTGGAVPVLSNTGLPVINSSFSVDLSQAKSSTGAVLLLGDSNTAWKPLPLPFDLSGLGAKGCSLLVSGQVLLTTSTDALGNAAVKLSVPNDPALLKASIHNQFFVLDVGANALGLAWTNGGTGTIG